MSANFIHDVLRPAYDRWSTTHIESHKKLTQIINARFIQHKRWCDLIDDDEYQPEYKIYKEARRNATRLGEQIVSFDPQHFGEDPYNMYDFCPGAKMDFYNHLTTQGVLADCDDFDARWEAFIVQGE